MVTSNYICNGDGIAHTETIMMLGQSTSKNFGRVNSAQRQNLRVVGSIPTVDSSIILSLRCFTFFAIAMCNAAARIRNTQ